MNKDTMWNIVLIISVILILHGMTNVGDTDKKTADAAAGETGLGAIGAVASAIGKKAIWPLLGPILLILAAGPFILGNWKNFFFPQSIPMWVWIAGFFILFMMMSSKKN